MPKKELAGETIPQGKFVLQGTESAMFVDRRTCRVLSVPMKNRWIMSIEPPYEYEGVIYDKVAVSPRNTGVELEPPFLQGVGVYVMGFSDSVELNEHMPSNVIGINFLYSNFD